MLVVLFESLFFVVFESLFLVVFESLFFGVLPLSSASIVDKTPIFSLPKYLPNFVDAKIDFRMKIGLIKIGLTHRNFGICHTRTLPHRKCFVTVTFLTVLSVTLNISHCNICKPNPNCHLKPNPNCHLYPY